MWGSKFGGCIYVYKRRNDSNEICHISEHRITNYTELPSSFQIKKVYFKATQTGESWAQTSFVRLLNFTGTPGIACIYIEI